MNNIVDELVRKVDKGTAEKMTPGKVLHLYGSEDSRYLKGVKAKAEKMGITPSWENTPPFILCVPYVVDRETCPKSRFSVIPGDRRCDLDCSDSPGMSCTAEAVSMILRALMPDPVQVCIIGRGHAVKGLAEDLLRGDNTVTVCHSKTNADGLRMLTRVADVTVNTARTLHPYYHFAPCTGSVLLDVSGSLSTWENSNTITYVGPRDIGRLNTALLINRLAKR
jgi:hypothetical protein